LQAIGGVTTIRGMPSGLEVYLDSSSFDEISLRERIALYYRYNLDFHDIKTFVNDSNRHWVYSPAAYWAKRF
jgi:hypothetical protein